MDAVITLRQEIHEFIDEIPERRLALLKPLLAELAEQDLIIETDLTEEEHALIEDSVRRYRASPASFITLDKLKADL